MAGELRIPFEEFSAHIRQVLEQVIRERQTIVVEVGRSDVVTLQPGEPTEPPATAARVRTRDDYEAFLRTAGSWSDFDGDAFLREVYASRDHAARPPVEL